MVHDSTKILSERGQFWLGHIQQWQPLEITQAEYCRSHKLSVAAFRWWRGQLARQGFDTGAILMAAKKTAKGATFVELMRPQAAVAMSHPYEIQLAGARRLSICQGFDSDEVATLVSILESSC